MTGVHAVFHVAAPLPGKASADETIKVYRSGLEFDDKLTNLATVQTAVEGSLNVLRQGDKAGIEKFVVTSSFGAVIECKTLTFVVISLQLSHKYPSIVEASFRRSEFHRLAVGSRYTR